jgi:sugar phosphate isomerase/epimerase
MKQTRRKFLANTTGAVIALSGIPVITAEPKSGSSGFGIKIYATRWGFKGSPDEFCKQVKADGFDGVEDWIPNDPTEENSLFEALDKYNLLFGALAGSSGSGFKEHLDGYTNSLLKAVSKKPDFINSHAGRDFFSFDENMRFIDQGNQVAEQSGIPVYQETHRARMLFAAHICSDYIKAVPELKLTLDISHWCAVAESLLDNQKAAVNKALARTEHIHARIGHEEGAQVNDPRAPEWKKASEAHYSWWDQVVALKKKAGEKLTVTTEFGPPNYMWTLPYTQQPVADQWAINVHMMNDFRKRYL